MVPQSGLQRRLDAALERAPESVRLRFSHLDGAELDVSESPKVGQSADMGPQAFRVAIAIVTRNADVLIVCRRTEDGESISWQFPAGVVKPGGSPERVAVRETLDETGVHCVVVRSLGSRLHPVTNVLCDYLLCDYLAGEAVNVDVVENVSVIWTARSELTRFIPAHQIYPPILEALEVTSDSAES